MAEKLYIGGELESKAVDGVVAAASAIKDKAKGKFQGEINAEVSETLAAHSSAISGLDGQNYVTLVATDADADIAAVFTRLSVTPAVNTIYRIANWKHDATTKYNTAYYSEYAANGTTTADLVPISVENKGIDDEPTAGSNNLVKSGGAASMVLKLASLNATMGDVSVGDIYFNPNQNSLRKKISANENIEVPFYDGAVYTYNNELYVWNGSDLTKKTINISIDSTTGSVSLKKNNAEKANVANADKILKLDAFTSSPSSLEVGSVYYNPTNKVIKRKVSSSSYETIPFYSGAIYTYNNELYIWDGTNLVKVSDFSGFPSIPQIDNSPKTGYALVGDGYSIQNADAEMCKYAVTAGDILLVNLSKDNGGVYQFQNSSSVSESGEQQLARVVGTPVTLAARGLIYVPEGATYLIVSQNISNTKNEVRSFYKNPKGIPTTILERCTEQIENVFAGADYHRYEAFREQNFALLMCSDVHADGDRLKNALYLLENCPAINAGILVGDIENNSGQTGDFIPTVAVPAINACNKPIICVMGNHDQRRNETDTITTEQSVARYMGATKEASHYTARGYGYMDFDASKVRVITLNCYDYTNDSEETDTTRKAQFGDTNMFLQAQIDWLISTLNSVPSGYAVIIAMHYPEPTSPNQNIIPRHLDAIGIGQYNQVGENGYQSDSVIADIVQAYIEKTTITGSYAYHSVTASIHGEEFLHTCPSASMPAAINVNADFTNAHGVFATYIFGHLHSQYCGFNTKHNNQNAYGNDTSFCYTATSGRTHLRNSMFPRDLDGASQDLVTVLCVDVRNKFLNLVRVGANRNIFGELYDFISVPFSTTGVI